MRFLSLRAVFLLGFVVAMPVLALPPVARRIDELLYGPPPTDFGRPPIAAPPLEELSQPKIASPVAPALFDDPSPAIATVATATLQQPVSPPTLPPTPQFEPPTPSPATATAPAPETRIDERTIARLHQIRQRLEDLGADYIIVETQNGGRFRFHCRMLLDSQSRFTKPFEASSFDPITAGDQVLREVEQWRATATQGQANLAR